MIQSLIFIKIGYSIYFQFEEATPDTPERSRYLKEVGTVLGAILLYLNYRYYKGRYALLDGRWGQRETARQRRVRGWLVAASLVLPLVVYIYVYGWLLWGMAAALLFWEWRLRQSA